MSAQFIVLGAGAWGTALAIHLARQSHQVILWGHDVPALAALSQKRENTDFLPGVLLPKALEVTSDLAFACERYPHAWVLIAVPSFAFEETLKRLRPFFAKKRGLILATKGLSQQGQLLHTFCERDGLPLAVICGPSFAKEVAKGLPTALTLASTKEQKTLCQLFCSNSLQIVPSHDLIGAQLGGVVKNVLAIAVGMSDGVGFGANARCALITHGMAELCALGEKLGAKQSTLMGLSGMGDMILTCTDNQSRNRRFGLALGQGQSVAVAEKAIGQVVEGKANVTQLMALAKEIGARLPICEQVHAVLFQGAEPSTVMNLLAPGP